MNTEPPLNQPSSDALDARDMAKLVAGNDAALNDIVTRHSGRVFAYLLRSLQDHEDAADLAQETFVRVYMNRGRFDPKLKFSTWLYTIAANLVRDRFRWRSRHPQVALDASESDESFSIADKLVDSSLEPGAAMESDEQSQAVRKAVSSLPIELREPLILSVYEALSHAEIATVLKCSAKAVETRLYRARKLLRDKLLKPAER